MASILVKLPADILCCIVQFLRWKDRLSMSMSSLFLNTSIDNLYEEMTFDTEDREVIYHLTAKGNCRLFFELKNRYSCPGTLYCLNIAVRCRRWELYRQIVEMESLDELNFDESVLYIMTMDNGTSWKDIKKWFAVSSRPLAIHMILIMMEMNKKKIARYFIKKYIKHANKCMDYKRYATVYIYILAINHNNIPLLDMLYGMRLDCCLEEDIAIDYHYLLGGMLHDMRLDCCLEEDDDRSQHCHYISSLTNSWFVKNYGKIPKWCE